MVVVVGGSVVVVVVVVVVGGVVNLDSFTASGSGWLNEVDLTSVCTVGAGAKFGDGAKPTIAARVADCSMMATASSSPVGGSNAAKPAIAMVAIASHASAASRRE